LVIDSLGNVLKNSYTALSLYTPQILLHNKSRKEIYTLGINKSGPGNNFYILNHLRCFNDTSLITKFISPNITSNTNDYLQSAILYHNNIYATFSSEVWSPPVPFPGNLIRLSKIKIIGQYLSTSSKYFMPHDTAGNASTANIMADKDKLIFAGYNSYTGFNYHICDTNLQLICLQKINGLKTPNSVGLAGNTLLKSGRIAAVGNSIPIYYTPGQSVGHWYSLSANYEEFVKTNCGNYAVLNEFGYIYNKLTLYPNPSSDEIIIDFKNEDSFETILFITNSVGKTIITTKLDNNNKNILNISELQNGMYFCNLFKNGNCIASVKLIKI
jgi:hypothetical protein